MWAALTIADGSVEPDALYPVPGPERDTIVLEPSDGPVTSFSATAIVVKIIDEGAGTREHVRVVAPTKVFLTDCRLAFASSRYLDSALSDNIVNGLIAYRSVAYALVDHAIDKASLRRRTKGSMLVGHVRHPWLLHVGAQAGNRKFPSVLRLVVRHVPNELDQLLSVDLHLPRGTDAGALADQVCARAATYRLRDGTCSDALRTRLTELTTPRPLAPAKGQLSLHRLSPAYLVKATTSYLGPAGPAAAPST